MNGNLSANVPNSQPTAPEPGPLLTPRDEVITPQAWASEGPCWVAPSPEAAPSRRAYLPLLLALGTFFSVLWTGSLGGSGADGWWYAVPLMIILAGHEGGHYFQARRYGVRASVPYLIPLPVVSFFIGTLGAVIAMDPRVRNRRALFDIGISGPLAGLVPTLLCVVLGLHWSRLDVPTGGFELGEPLIFTYLGYLRFGPIPEGQTIILHSLGYAGWVGLLITALNLMPIGQLDGGHILYSILGSWARRIALAVFLGLVAAAVAMGFQQWYLMLFFLALVGPEHPPTADDSVPLGWGRAMLGWLTLAFVIVGFTPNPLPGLTGGP